MFLDDKAHLWQALQVVRSAPVLSRYCGMTAVFPDLVEYSTAQVRLHFFSILVMEESIALVTMFSFKNSALGLEFLCM